MPEKDVSAADGTAASIIVWPDDGKEMVFVPGGTFLMGSNDNNPNHQPEHQVTVSDFYIDRWPVTNTEYKKFIDCYRSQCSQLRCELV